MRRFLVMLAVTALLVAAVAVPAFASKFPILGKGPVNSCKAFIASEASGEHAPFCPGLREP